MEERLAQYRKEFEEKRKNFQSSKDIEREKIAYLGKKGVVQGLMSDLRTLTAEEKPRFGKEINLFKCCVEQALDEDYSFWFQKEELEALESEKEDVTLPGRRYAFAAQHPISEMIEELVDIFSSMGFSVQSSPEIETDYYNFEALNFEEDHPAREMQDTFYVDENILLRTHTTAIQTRLLESKTPPIRMICPGRCYRNETISSRSHVNFHQIDVMYVDKNVSMQDLAATSSQFLQKLFHKGVTFRFRNSYFPFVEPGVEVDMSCYLCKQKGCSLCKGTGWLEIFGAGMVHPHVLKNCGHDPETYQGYAMGVGVERMQMLRYGIDDIRLLFENDQRFLNQFPL